MRMILLACALALAGACGKKATTRTDDTTPRPTANDRGERAAPDTTTGDPTTIETTGGDGDATTFTAVYFEFDASELSAEGRRELERLAAWLEKRPNAVVTLEGHADAQGTAEYNVALGQRRAQVMQRFLIDLGVAKHRVKTISFGEERPAVGGDGESAWALNRRGELRPDP